MGTDKSRRPDESIRSEQYLRPVEVARMLKMNVETVYHYIKEGKLPAARLGRRYIVSRRDLTEFLEKRKSAEVVEQLALSEKGASMVEKVADNARRVRILLEEYPGATNEEIAEALDIDQAESLRALRQLEAKKRAVCESDKGEPDRKRDPWYPLT